MHLRRLHLSHEDRNHAENKGDAGVEGRAPGRSLVSPLYLSALGRLREGGAERMQSEAAQERRVRASGANGAMDYLSFMLKIYIPRRRALNY